MVMSPANQRLGPKQCRRLSRLARCVRATLCAVSLLCSHRSFAWPCSEHTCFSGCTARRRHSCSVNIVLQASGMYHLELVLLPERYVQVLGPRLGYQSCRNLMRHQTPHHRATMQALGRGQGNLDPQGLLSVESLMDEIIDRANDEDDEMGVRCHL